MKNKKYKLVIFDMDGTLINSDPMILESFHILYDKYNNGVRKSDDEIYYFSGPPIRETLKNEFPNLDQEFIYNEFHRVSEPLYQSHIFAYPHSLEVIDKLKKDGFKLAIVTNKRHHLTLVALKKLGLDKYFDTIIAYDDVKKGKPHPEGILKAIKENNESLATSIYIGDNAVDFLSAKNAQIDSIIVSWGPRKIKENISPTYYINSYLELEEKLYE